MTSDPWLASYNRYRSTRTCTFYLTHTIILHAHLINSARYSRIYGAQISMYYPIIIIGCKRRGFCTLVLHCKGDGMTSMMQLHGQYVIHIIMHVHAQVNLVQSRQKASCGAANTTPFWHVNSGFINVVFRCSCDKHYNNQ